jgi:glycosyltransferase involved in cell wall biosynthesis
LQLSKIKETKVNFTIYGAIEDDAYWNNCKIMISKLPSNVIVYYKGILNNKDISDVLIQHHFLIQLSYSENYGHSIVEALHCGIPVIISNQTPWHNLEQQKAGWDINLEDKERLLSSIKYACEMDNDEYEIWSQSAINYSKQYCINQDQIDKIKNMFSSICLNS